MLENLEQRLQDLLDKTPFLIKLFYYPEISAISNALEESRKLRSNYVNNAEWFSSYAQVINKGFDAAYNFVDVSYAMYENLTAIPFFGGFVSGWVNNYLSRSFHINRLPDKAHVNHVLDALKTTSLETVRTASLLKTGTAPEYRQVYSPTHFYAPDPSPVRNGVNSVFSSIGNMFSYVFS
ncbi:MAG: hypothetical protein V1859_07935 [archaeon]